MVESQLSIKSYVPIPGIYIMINLVNIMFRLLIKIMFFSAILLEHMKVHSPIVYMKKERF